MKDTISDYPKKYSAILKATEQIGFGQLSDGKVGAFLASLCASKPRGKFLELGTGSGLCTSWMLAGMCEQSTLITVDKDESLVDIAKNYLGDDSRVTFVVGDGAKVIEEVDAGSVDLIFADTWPGKYHHLDEAISLLKVGGVYLIDDMAPQSNWPDGHDLKAEALAEYLTSRSDLRTVKMHWSTGLIMCVKVALL